MWDDSIPAISRLLDSVSSSAVQQVQQARLQQAASVESATFCKKVLHTLCNFAETPPQNSHDIARVAEEARPRIMCKPQVEKIFKIRKESKKPSICTTISRNSVISGFASGVRVVSPKGSHTVNAKCKLSKQSSQAPLVKLEEEPYQPQPEIDFLRRHKIKADELTKMMLRTCQSRQHEDNEPKRPVRQLRAQRNIRFTTDYDGTKIPFKKHKDQNQPAILNRVFITQRIVQPKQKTRYESFKLNPLKTNGSDAGVPLVINEPVNSRLQMQEVMGSLQLAKGVTIEFDEVLAAWKRAEKNAGSKTIARLALSEAGSNQVLGQHNRGLDSLRSLASKKGTTKRIDFQDKGYESRHFGTTLGEMVKHHQRTYR